MERADRIRRHPLYQEAYEQIKTAEKNRKFCNHTMEHFLDVARLMWIYVLEEHALFSRELVYAAALLHDMGRAEQYLSGMPHEKAGALLAERIMTDCGFGEAEICEVKDAILSHRNKNYRNRQSENRDAAGAHTLGEYLYRADKRSRSCFICPAEKECNWPQEKKNLQIAE